MDAKAKESLDNIRALADLFQKEWVNHGNEQFFAAADALRCFAGIAERLLQGAPDARTSDAEARAATWEAAFKTLAASRCASCHVAPPEVAP